MKKTLTFILISLFLFNNICFAATKAYDFSDNAQTKYKQSTSTSNVEYDINKPLVGSVLKIEKGATFNCALKSSLNTESASKGDNITAVLMEDFGANGVLLAPRGSLVYGKITKAKTSGYAYGNGEIDINFSEIVPPKGESIKISTEKISFDIGVEASRGVEVGKKVATGAIIGLVSAAIIGLFTDDYGKALAIGATAGAVGGGINSAFQKGQELEIPQNTVMQLKLNKGLSFNYNH